MSADTLRLRRATTSDDRRPAYERSGVVPHPAHLVIRWLGEAYGHGSLEAYARALLHEEPDQLPINPAVPGLARGTTPVLVLSTLELLVSRVTELQAAADARRLAEDRYLDGYAALFPDAVRAWEEQVHSTLELTAIGFGLADAEAIEPPEQDEDALAERTEELLVDLVEPAKATAHEKLGDGWSGLDIANSWSRTKLDRSGPPETADSVVASATL